MEFSLCLQYFKRDESDTSNHLRVKFSSHVKNVSVCHQEANNRLSKPYLFFKKAIIQGGTFNISVTSAVEQSPNLSLHSAKRCRHYMVESADSD